MLAERITIARKTGKKIVHKPELKALSEIALQAVADNYLLYKTLDGLEDFYKNKVYDLMSTDYDIKDLFPYIDYEPFWKRACVDRFKSDDCSIAGNSWKQLYVENHIKDIITNYKPSEENSEDLEIQIKDIFFLLRFYVYNLDIPTFSCRFDISLIPQYFANLTTLTLKYSPVLRDKKTDDIFTKNLEPIGDEYSNFGIRIPDLQKFCLLITDLNYFISLTLQGNLVDDEMIKWLVPGLITNQTLRHLDLSSNRITEKGMIKISSFLVRTRSLLSINLTDNLIGSESAYAIGLTIKENTKLRILKLAMNRLDDESGVKIVKMLAFNKNLEELDLSSNLLGNLTLRDLQKALKANATILKIDLSHNQELEIYNETIKVCEMHPTLIDLNVKHTKSTKELTDQLEKKLIKKAIKHKLNPKNDYNKL